MERDRLNVHDFAAVAKGGGGVLSRMHRCHAVSHVSCTEAFGNDDMDDLPNLTTLAVTYKRLIITDNDQQPLTTQSFPNEFPRFLLCVNLPFHMHFSPTTIN